MITMTMVLTHHSRVQTLTATRRRRSFLLLLALRGWMMLGVMKKRHRWSDRRRRRRQHSAPTKNGWPRWRTGCDGCRVRTGPLWASVSLCFTRSASCCRTGPRHSTSSSLATPYACEIVNPLAFSFLHSRSYLNISRLVTSIAPHWPRSYLIPAPLARWNCARSIPRCGWSLIFSVPSVGCPSHSITYSMVTCGCSGK